MIIFSAGVFSQDHSEKKSEFDFWIGEWDVNLRVLQKDNSWKDQHRAVARIYSILDGKAVLELWSENQSGINGYSLRYYNPNKNKWDLWLNWAGKNRSGTFGLEGEFRHGRGEFFAERKIDEKTAQISRYTFSDITENSLRWDDGTSADGGRTWGSNWIMEFTRRAKKAPVLAKEKNLHTYFDGSRCDAEQFSAFKQFPANQKDDPALGLYNILDGCIIIGFIEQRDAKAFFTLTYNTYANVYELTYLDDREGTALAIFYGGKTADGFTFQTRGGEPKAVLKSNKTIELLEVEYEGKKQSFRFED